MKAEFHREEENCGDRLVYYPIWAVKIIMFIKCSYNIIACPICKYAELIIMFPLHVCFCDWRTDTFTDKEF